MVKTMAKLRMAHASTHGARKPPGPKVGNNNGQLCILTPPRVAHAKPPRPNDIEERPKVGNNNGQLRIAMPPRVAHAKPPGPKI